MVNTFRMVRDTLATMMKKILATTFVIAALATACGSDGPSADAPTVDGVAADIASGDCVSPSGETVTIYSGRKEDLVAPILEAFECESGIETLVRYDSSVDLALALNEEGDTTKADVFLSRSPGPVGFLEERGMLGTVSSDVLDLVDEENRAASGAWAGFSGRQRVLVYNLDNAADDLPDSVFDLTEERYNGRVAIPGSNGSFEDWFTVFRFEVGDDIATKWLDDMVSNGAKFYADNRSIVDAVGRGEIDFGLVNHYYNYQESEALGDEHRGENYTFPNDDLGSINIITAAAILDGSEHADAGNALIAYLLSEGAQRYFTEETYEYPLAAGVEPASILPPLSALEVGSIDFDQLGGGFAATEEIIQASGILNQ
jgi:iron(III) transport system substrate-binding protein